MSKLKLVFLENDITTRGFSELGETETATMGGGVYTITTFAKMVINEYLKNLDINNISITVSNGATSYLLFIQTEFIVDMETIKSGVVRTKDLKITTHVTMFKPNGAEVVLVDTIMPIPDNVDLATFKDCFDVVINSAEEALVGAVPKWLVDMFKCYAAGRGES